MPDTVLDRQSVKIQSVLIVANPTAGGFHGGLIDAVVADLKKNDIRAEVYYSKHPGDITRLLQDADLSIDAVAVHGGDGSIGEAVAALHDHPGPRPALIVIPGGTASVLACELELPTAAKDIVESIVKGKTAPLYYGLANGRPFFLMVSAGVDAEVVHAVSPGLKRRLGKLAFLVAALGAIRRHATPDIRVTSDSDGPTHCRLAVVANSACYGGKYVLSPKNSVCRPGLRLVTMPKDDLASLLRIGWRMFSRRNAPTPDLSDRAVAKVHLTSARPAPAQIDGEPFGTTPVDVEPVARPLRIVVGSDSITKT